MKKIIMVSMLMLTVLFTGCGKSEEEKKMEREDREERLETEAMMRMWGFDDETIEQQVEGKDFIETRTNMAQWSGEVKEKVKKKYKEDITVYYYYSVGDYLYINSHDGFVTTTYLDYCR